MVILQSAFVRSDFGFALVASHSSTTTPLFYRLTAVWSSQEGSLLLWVLLLSLWSSLVLYPAGTGCARWRRTRRRCCSASGPSSAGCSSSSSRRSRSSPPRPPKGVGLNPLLRHPSMMIHPPMLYSGYTLFAIPFAFAVGALVTRRLGAEWIRSTRPFTLAAWFLLGMGIVLGARWSYSELGWGGYWAWDPVENASLMPWLTGTAFLHSVMIQEKRGMLKVWNVSLVLATGVLAILGTFLVRSGILESIHAFGASTLGVPFLVLIVVMIGGSIALVASRAEALRSEHRLDSLLSREAAFLLNNLVLVGLCFVVFWGTFFPLISEALTGEEASVGPPWFNRYITPLALILVLLSGIGPLIAWRRATAANLRRNFALPVAAGVVVLLVLLAAGVTSSVPALLMFAFAAFVLGAVGQEFWRGVRARRAMARESVPVALVSLVRRNRRRYGGYLVHVGVAVLFCGVAASSAFQNQELVSLRPGQTATVGGYAVTYVKPTSRLVAASNGRLERIDLGADLRVRRGDDAPRVLHTYKSYFPSTDPSLGPVSRFFEGESTSEVGLQAGVRRDLWTAVAPDIARLAPVIDEGDKVFSRARLSDEQRGAFLAEALGGISRSYVAQPAAGDLPHHRVTARDLDLARRADRRSAARRSRSGPPAAAPGAPRGPRGSRAWPASSAACSGVPAHPGPDRARRPGAERAAARAAGAGGGRERRARRARGGAGRQVRRDPRRRARLPHGQAVGGRLAGARPPAARRGGGPAAPPATRYPDPPMYTVLSVIQVFIAVVLIFLILLHSGKDAGMSGAFGVGVAGGTTGGSLDGAQPGPLDDPLRGAVRREHDRPPQARLAQDHARARAQGGRERRADRQRGVVVGRHELLRAGERLGAGQHADRVELSGAVDRPGPLARLDQPRAVEQPAAAGGQEGGDEEGQLERGDQLVDARGPAARQDEVVGPRRGVPGAGRVARRDAGGRVGHDLVGHPVLDQRHRAPGHALRVVGARQRAREARRVGQVDRGGDDARPAPRGDQAVGRRQLRLEQLEHLRHGDRPEDDGPLARLGGLGRSLVEAGARRGRECRHVDAAGADRGGHRPSGRLDLRGGEAALLEGVRSA